ncbi:MAG: hypothetical protein ACR2KL_00040 [Nocardioidaceae bacterium]
MRSLAALATDPPDPATVTAGWIGFLVLAGLGFATYLLVRSMNRHLKRIDFDEDETGRSGAGDQGPADGGGGATRSGDGPVPDPPPRA